MVQLPNIYTIQASDAQQHTGKLQEILQQLKRENRIEGFTAIGPEEDLSSITGSLQDGDLVLVLLTHQLEPHKEQITSRLKALKADRSGLRVGEIIVDNVTFVKEFLTFPVDLRPIRDRKDMDEGWRSIEQSLKDMFPISDKPDDPEGTNFMLISFIVLAILLVGWIGWKMISSEEVEVKVPEMAEMTLNEARAELENKGLFLSGQREEHHTDIPRNRVTRSSPPVDRSVEEGTGITLYISLGPEPVEDSGKLIRPRANQTKCIHKRENNWNNGNPIHLWDCDAGEAAFKKWIYEAETGYIRSAENPEKCMHKDENNWNNGNPIHLWDCDAGEAAFKSWKYEAETGYIRSTVNPEKCMHKDENNWNNGNPIHLWDCDAGVAAFKSWVIE